jgi:frataxin-like iron-binding protein CyaY
MRQITMLNMFKRDVIWSVRINEIQSNVIDHLSQLIIWNAGKQVGIHSIVKQHICHEWITLTKGRKFYRSLNESNKRKVCSNSFSRVQYTSSTTQVIGFCDMDPKKIAKGFYTDEFSSVNQAKQSWRTTMTTIDFNHRINDAYQSCISLMCVRRLLSVWN